MRNYLFILTFHLWLLAQVATCQNLTYFNKVFDVNQGLEVAWNLIEVDSGYIVEGGFGIDTLYPDNWLVGILFIDKLGNEKWKRYYSIAGQPVNTNYYSGFPGSFNPLSSGGYALGGGIQRDSAANGDVVLWRFDDKLDTLWTHIYDDTVWATAYHSAPTPDGGFILTGGYGGNVMMLMKTDSDGNKEWLKTYPPVQASIQVIVTPDSGYFSGFSRYYNSSYTKGYVIKTNKDGIQQWYYETDTVIPWIESYCVTRDSGYLLAAPSNDLYNIGDPYGSGHFAFIKLDKNGNEKWKKLIGGIYIYTWDAWQIQQLDDGSFLFTGQGNVDGIGADADELKGVALKFSEQGDSIWYREYRYCALDGVGTIQYFRWGIPTSDGGYIFCGFTSPSACVRQNMWVVKTNCLGFEAPPSPHFYWKRDTSTSNAILFTNTSLYSDSTYYIFGDDASQMVRNATNYQIDDTITYFTHIYPDTGYYIVTTIAAACGDTTIFTDTIYVTNVGIDEFKGESLDFKVYPNPTQGTITATYNFPNEKSILFQITDILGNVLLVEQLSSGSAKKTIDISVLPIGQYFYSVITNGTEPVRGKLIILR